MKKRSIIILSIDILLAIILVFQIITKTKSTTKVFTTTQEINQICIINKDVTIDLFKENDKWYIGPEKILADEFQLKTMENTISSITCVESVGKANNDVLLDKYQLLEGKCIKVIAKNNGTVVRTIVIGKAASTRTHVYAMIDDSKDILLLTGNLSALFDKNIDSLKVQEEQTESAGQIPVIPTEGMSL